MEGAGGIRTDETMAGPLFFRRTAGFPSASSSCRDAISDRGMGKPERHSLRTDCDLWGNCGAGGGKAGKVTYVCSRGGFGGGAESDFHPHPLPQGGGSGWKPDRVCRRTRKEVEAFEAGRSRFERGRQASLTALLRKGKTKKGRQRRTTENGRREGGRFPFLMRGEIVSCSSICLLSYR